MAEGCTREQAIAVARGDDGAEPESLRLPAAELPLIRLALATVGQWRIATGLAGACRLALDMTAVDATARWLGITPSLWLFEGLSIIEREALRMEAAA